MSIKLDSYKGVRDFYPEDMQVLEYIINTWKKSLQQFGYQNYNASILEPTELFEAKSSDEIVNEQTYTFTDRGDRRVTLRPEMTPTLARMVAKKQKELMQPIRWFSYPNVFRYEQPQKGRLREHWQLNVDLLGLSNINAEIEIITIASQIMKNFGLNQEEFVVRINDREILNSIVFELGLDGDKKKDFFRLLDRKDKDPNFSDKMQNLIGKKFIITPAPSKKIEKMIESLSAIGINNIVFDPYLVRGFDYYTGVVFEIYDTNPENRRAIFGGGRYDKLVESFGGESITAIGFGMGDVSLRDMLDIRGLLPTKNPQADLGICIINDESVDLANQIANTLRNSDINVLIDYSFSRISNQIEKMNKRKVPFIICIGRGT